MSTTITIIVLAAIVLGPFALVASLATRAQGSGYLGWHIDRFRFAAPMAGRWFEDDADLRRIGHDVDAIRTRFQR